MKIVRNRQGELILKSDKDQEEFGQMRPVKTEPLSHPYGIVLFSTGGDSFPGAVNWATTPGSDFLPHLIVGEEGQIVQLVPFDRQCRMFGEVDSVAVSVALVNFGRLHKLEEGVYLPLLGDEVVTKERLGGVIVETAFGSWVPYTVQQVAVLMRLTALLRATFGGILVKTIDELMTHDPLPDVAVGQSLRGMQMLRGFSSMLKVRDKESDEIVGIVNFSHGTLYAAPKLGRSKTGFLPDEVEPQIP